MSQPWKDEIGTRFSELPKLADRDRHPSSVEHAGAAPFLQERPLACLRDSAVLPWAPVGRGMSGHARLTAAKGPLAPIAFAEGAETGRLLAPTTGGERIPSRAPTRLRPAQNRVTLSTPNHTRSGVSAVSSQFLGKKRHGAAPRTDMRRQGTYAPDSAA